MSHAKQTLQCQCGQVSLATVGSPIISAECLCLDCQKAGAVLQQREGAPAIVGPCGETRFVLYRKDRVEFQRGQENLKAYYLQEDSPTRRVIAGCCNTPVFLEFSAGHWFSLYGALWSKEKLPPLEIRTMAASRPDGVELPNDVPNPKAHTFLFYFKLLRAWMAMGFRTPKLGFVVEKL